MWQWANPLILFLDFFYYLTTVEFSKYLEAFLRVPVNFIFLSHWLLTWKSCDGNFSLTPIHLLSKLKAWLFLWWSSVSSLSLVVKSVSNSLKMFKNSWISDVQIDGCCYFTNTRTLKFSSFQNSKLFKIQKVDLSEMVKLDIFTVWHGLKSNFYNFWTSKVLKIQIIWLWSSENQVLVMVWVLVK